jgi:hypothetical protein
MSRYVVVTWPESQNLFDIPGFEENSYLVNDDRGMEDFGGSAYFVDEEWLDSIEDGGENPDSFVSSVITDCYHSMDDGEDYYFDEPLEMGDRIAIGFYEDDGNEDVRIITLDKEGKRDDLFLSSMPTDTACQLAKRIDNVEYAWVDMDDRTIEKPWDYFAHSE